LVMSDQRITGLASVHVEPLYIPPNVNPSIGSLAHVIIVPHRII